MNIMLRFITLLLLFICVVIPAACQEKRRRPSRYLIPDGYVGWMRINFNVKGAPPTPIEDGHYLFRFPPSGLLETSSEIEYGVASGDDYFYYSGDTRRKLTGTMWGGGMIWGEATGWSGNNFAERTDVHEIFFVGTEEEFNKYGSLKDENYTPKIGNVKAKAASNNGMQRTRKPAIILPVTSCARR